MSFEVRYARNAAQNIQDEDAKKAILHLCKALEEAQDEIKKLHDDVRRLRASGHSH